MKKSIILISSIILMIAITGCSSKQKSGSKQAEKKLVGVPNPIHESSAAEIITIAFE